MLPLILTDRNGQPHAFFKAGVNVPSEYYPVQFDRKPGWAMRFVHTFALAELAKLADYANARSSFGLEPLIELIEERRLLVYRRDTSKEDRLAVEALRDSVRKVLDRILAEEKKEADAIEREHEKRNVLHKMAAYQKAFDDGATEGAVSLLKFVKEVGDLANPLRPLINAGKSAWDAAEGGIEGFAVRFVRNMNDEQFGDIADVLGFDPRKVKPKHLLKAYEIAKLVWEDEETQIMFVRFARDMAAAQHSLEWASMAGGMVFEWIFTAILAAVTAGAGVAAALANKGKLMHRLGELLSDMSEPLRRLRKRWGAGRGGKGKGRGGSGSAPEVEEVDVPGYNEPPRAYREPSPTTQELVQDAPGQPRRVADVHYDHILDGEVKPITNGAGEVVGKRAVGGHYSRSSNVHVTEVVNGPDRNGVFEARIQVRDPETGAWVNKNGKSTFYPEHWSRRQTQTEIQEAFYNSKPLPGGDKWEGVSPSGVKIQGYYKKPEGSAATAWPVYGG